MYECSTVDERFQFLYVVARHTAHAFYLSVYCTRLKQKGQATKYQSDSSDEEVAQSGVAQSRVARSRVVRSGVAQSKVADLDKDPKRLQIKRWRSHS